MTLPADLARIRAFAAMSDIPSLTPPPYVPPFHAFDRDMVAMLNRLWEAAARPVPFRVLNDVRERCELLSRSWAHPALVQHGVCAEGEFFVVSDHLPMD